MSAHRMLLGVLGAFVLVVASLGSAHATSVSEAEKTISEFKRTDPGMAQLFETSAGYVVFPTVGKGAVGVGGARGKGILFERGKPTGRVTLTQVSVGLQLGGQSYSEVIFFKTPRALAEFRSGEFTLSAQASAVALKSGASANAKWESGVAVFTSTEEGLMYEASVGGQKFDVDLM